MYPAPQRPINLGILAFDAIFERASARSFGLNQDRHVAGFVQIA